jgi:very-short-patch-repair endonuclease
MRRRWRGTRDKRDLARELRKRPTTAEDAAWRLLRDRRLHGCKFRRQHVIAGYIVDFYCPELRLVLELDGGYHETPEQEARDAQRSDALAERGIRVVRVSSTDVRNATLQAAVRPYLLRPSHLPSPAYHLPSPASAGEGEGEGQPG